MTDFDREIKKALAGAAETCDPGRVKAAVRAAMISETERNTGTFMRKNKKLTFVLAAAAALILLSTAAAATVMAVQAAQAKIRAGSSSVEKAEKEGEYIVSYDIEIEEHTGSVVLSDEVMAALEALNPRGEDSSMVTELIAEGSVIPFDKWQDAADWFNCGLLVNPDLGALPNDNFHLHAYYNDGSVQNSRSVGIMGTHSYPDTKERVHVSAFIPLNEEAWQIYHGGHSGMVHNAEETPDEPEFAPDALTTVYGDEVTIVSTPYSNKWNVSAYFTHGGIIYTVNIWASDRDEAESVVRRVVENMR